MGNSVPKAAITSIGKQSLGTSEFTGLRGLFMA